MGMTGELSVSDSLDILALHASAVYVDNKAMIFLGPSGTGKSTICDLLSAHAQTLALDAVYLVSHADGGWAVVKGDGRAHGRSLSLDQATALYSVPLRMIFRLYQAPAPRLEPLDRLEVGRYLTDAFFEIVRQREYDFETKRCAFSSLSAIARTVPGYEFYFDLTPRTLETLGAQVGLW